MLTMPPLHIVAPGALVMVGAGFTVIVTVCGVPWQFPAIDVGVTVYVTICTEVVLFVIVLLKVLDVCNVKLSPVVLGLFAAIQV